MEGSKPNTYTINLEAFVTGESITEEGILGPIDYSLILDTSGSMMEFVGYGYSALENRQYTYPELADGYTSFSKWREDTNPDRYSVYFNNTGWNGYATKYAIKLGDSYYHILLCDQGGNYIAVYGKIGENSVSDVHSLSSTGSQFGSFSSGKTPNNTQLYVAAQSGSKLKLLKVAVSSFIDIVSNHAKENDLDHMISIVRYNADEKTNGIAIIRAKKGDSAIFNVYKIEKDGEKSLFPIQLVATCKEDGKPAIAKTKIQKEGRYMVEETPWSWAYGITECQKDTDKYQDISE